MPTFRLRSMRLTSFSLTLWLGLFSACGVEPLSVIGEQCDRNSDCSEPLVCGLGRCRRECETTRDCALGLRCLKLPDGLGVCQLPEEKNCALNSDCDAPLICFADVGCDIACITDVDCAAGSRCEDGQCNEPEIALCVYPSDCPYPLTCDARQRCREECSTDFDCERGSRCVPHVDCEGPCMCRVPCVTNDECPLGTDCVACEDEACGDVMGYCERPAPNDASG